ncbi:MAG: hypothetical protein J2P46_02090 [Zavarzinella sp.]|nr:hypothetical protein [Zavarzinella sp.]
MSSRTLTVAVPDNILARIRDRAKLANRSLEAEVVDLLTGAVAGDDAVPADVEAAIAGFDLLDEPALRRAAESRLSPKDHARLEHLNRKRRNEETTKAEERQRRELLRRYERAMLIRAAALAELHRRDLEIPNLNAP